MDPSTGLPIHHRTVLFTPEDIPAAALSGLGAGAVMGTIAMLLSSLYADEIDMWTPIKQVAALVYGPQLTRQGFEAGPVIIGTLIHLLTSATLGIVFAIVYRRILQLPFQLGLPFLAGGIYGIAIWGFAHALLPALNPVMAEADKPAFMLGHLAFGITLGLLYARLHPRIPAPAQGHAPAA